MRVLWLVAEDAVRAEEKQALELLAGCTLEPVAGAAAGLDELRAANYDVVLADLPLPDSNAEDLLEDVHRVSSLLPVIVRDSEASVTAAVRLARLGAFTVLEREAPLKELAREIEQAARHRRQLETSLLGSAGDEPWKQFLVGESRWRSSPIAMPE